MEPRSPFRISFQGLPATSGVRRPRVRALLVEVMLRERCSPGELHVAFVGDSAMRRVNRDYRGKDSTTDVLSFGYRDEPHAGSLLGEVLISLSVARAQAKEHGVRLDEEVARLALHGLLHVLGYDHETSRDYDRMIGLQEKYMTSLWGRSAAAKSRHTKLATKKSSDRATTARKAATGTKAARKTTVRKPATRKAARTTTARKAATGTKVVRKTTARKPAARKTMSR